MVDDLVMRSVYLRHSEDAQLRQLAHNLNVTKSDLIRAAIGAKLEDWFGSPERERILREVERGRPDATTRSGRRERTADKGAGRTQSDERGEVVSHARQREAEAV